MSNPNPTTPTAHTPGKKETNSKATWALVGGILSVTFCGFIVGIVSIVVGKQAQAEIAASGGHQGGETRAMWGIILGWVSIVMNVLALIIAAIVYTGS